MLATGMKLIFIGPDCGGKSTLAEGVGQALKIPVDAHRKISDEEMRVVVAEDALKQIRAEYTQWIRDQYYYPVDILYQATMAEEFSILSPMEYALANAYKLANVIFVYVTASPNELGKRFYERGDELWTLEQISKVAASYENWYELAKHNHHLVRIDTTNKDRGELVVEAIGLINQKHKEIKGVF